MAIDMTIDDTISTPTGEFTRFIPKRNENRVEEKYDFFISLNRTIIYKRNNQSSEQFNFLLTNQYTLESFKKILNGEAFEIFMQKHICNGFELEKDGSYKSNYIQGYRLDLLQSYTISDEVLQTISKQCEILINALEIADVQNKLFGDWALHNLIFSFENKCIINVDLEGFLTYNPLPDWANLEVIKTWINSLN